MHSDLALCTPEHVKSIMSLSDCVKSDHGVSPSSDNGGGLGFLALGIVKCTIRCVPLDGDRVVFGLGLTVDRLVHTRKTNPRMARKDKSSSVSSGKLVVYR